MDNITNDTKIFYKSNVDYKYSINEVIDIILENNCIIETTSFGVALRIKIYNHNGINESFGYNFYDITLNNREVKDIFWKEYKKAERLYKIKHLIDG